MAGALLAAAAASDQPADDHVGVIDGENITINGPMSVESVGGQIKTVLRSGSDVHVKSGQAKITLVEGGQVSICGPAHLSVLKAVGSLTIALDSGVIHVRVDQQPALTVYTPQVEAKSIAIGDDPRDLLVGFESPGVMCIRTYRGAMHLEQQLSGQSIVVPQGGDVLLTNGQIDTLRNGEGHCKCELQIAKAAPLPAAAPKSSSPATSTSADAVEIQGAQPASPSNDAPPSPEKPAPKDDVIYRVEMPPLQYNANAKMQPEPDPRLMIIVKRVRVRPTLIFQGHVQSAPASASVASPSSPAPTATTPPQIKKPTPPPAEPSVTDRVRSFFHHLWSHSS